MRLIKPSFEIIEQEVGLQGLFKHMELTGRVPYKSEEKITEDSAKSFIEMLIKREHYSPLEQGTIYLKYPIPVCTSCDINLNKQYIEFWNFYKYNSYTESKIDKDYLYITTNYRVLYENNRLNDLDFMVDYEDSFIRRVSVKFVIDRGVSHKQFVA